MKHLTRHLTYAVLALAIAGCASQHDLAKFDQRLTSLENLGWQNQRLWQIEIDEIKKQNDNALIEIAALRQQLIDAIQTYASHIELATLVLAPDLTSIQIAMDGIKEGALNMLITMKSTDFDNRLQELTNAVRQNGTHVPSPLEITLDQKTLDNLKPGAWSWLISLASAIIGGFIALGGTVFVFRRQQKTETIKQKNILRAIRREIQEMKTIYQGYLGAELESVKPLIPGGIIPKRASLSVNWFTVYEGNSEYLGCFKPKTTELLLNARAAILSLFESYRLNNAILDTWPPGSPFPQPPQVRAGLNALTGWTPQHTLIYAALQNRAKEIVVSDENMHKATRALFEHLDAEGIK